MNIKEVIANDSHLLKQVSREITEELESFGVKDSLIFDIRVAVEEALRNAMIHGNKLDPDKKVKVQAEVTGGDILIRVEDEGAGFDPLKVSDPTDEENILKTSGRGVYLMRHLMDDVIYENHGKRVVMRKRLKEKQ